MSIPADRRRVALAKALVADPSLSIEKAMISVGYSASYAHANGDVTKSKSFTDLLNDTIQDSSIIETMRSILNRRVLKKEIFNIDISDEVITDHVDKVGGQFTKIKIIIVKDSKREKKGKYFKMVDFQYEAKEVSYYIPDLESVDKMLDKLFKLRGNYVPDKASGRLTIGKLLVNLISNGTEPSQISTIVAEELAATESVPDQGQTGQDSPVSTEPSAETLSSQ